MPSERDMVHSTNPTVAGSFPSAFVALTLKGHVGQEHLARHRKEGDNGT